MQYKYYCIEIFVDDVYVLFVNFDGCCHCLGVGLADGSKKVSVIASFRRRL